MTTFWQDPDDVELYNFQWSKWLLEDETITARDHDVSPAGLTVVLTQNQNGDVIARISGGTSGSQYAVTCSVETSGGRKKDHTITVLVRSTTGG
jgi:hypothetical protein